MELAASVCLRRPRIGPKLHHHRFLLLRFEGDALNEIEALLAPIRELKSRMEIEPYGMTDPGSCADMLYGVCRLLAAVEAALQFAQKCEDYKGPGPQSPGPLYTAGCMDMARWTAKDLREAIASALRGETM